MQKQILNHLKPKFPWVGLRFISESMQRFSAENGQIKSPLFHLDQGLQVEVRSPDLKHIAYASTSDLSSEGCLAAAQKAFESAKLMQEYGLAPLSTEVRPVNQGNYQSPNKVPVDQLGADIASSILVDVTQKMKTAALTTFSFGQLALTKRNFVYLTSDGTHIEQDFNYWSQNFMCTAQQGSETQKRSFNGGHSRCVQGGLEVLDKSWLMEQAQKSAIQAVELLNSKECPQQNTHLVLAPDQMLLQIHESIGHPLELDRILGDERNYAGWSFVKLEDFGKLQYGSNLLNVVFDPTPQEAFASYAFDDGGLKSTKEFLIKEGLLVRPLGGAESQARSKIPGVANFRTSSWNRAPIDRMANIDVLPGETSFESMISNIEDGIYMESNTSWSIDDYRNKFQFGCEYARHIKNGKLGEVLKNPNYRGECLKFWRGLTQVGDSNSFERFGTPFCGKGEPSQIIRVSHASPVCHFSNVEVFGGH